MACDPGHPSREDSGFMAGLESTSARVLSLLRTGHLFSNDLSIVYGSQRH